MFTRPTWLTMTTAIALMTWASAATAGVLAPRKPSQSITLLTSGVSAPCGGTALDALVDTEILSDGTTAPFTIPSGMVLVIDGLSWAASSGTPDRLIGILIDIGGDLPNAPWNDSAISDSLGDAGHDVFVPNIPIKSGVSLCLHAGGTLTRGIVHGFLTKDK